MIRAGQLLSLMFEDLLKKLTADIIKRAENTISKANPTCKV